MKGGGMIKLMIVDDEVEICDFVKNFFKERNFEVFTAYNGKEALDIIEAQNPDIVLLDIRMPVMDGMQMLKELHRRSKNSKVIMVTAAESPEKEEEARSYGAIEYIAKPLSLERLERSVFEVAEKIEESS